MASWRVKGERLDGHIALPMQVGVVGGTIKNHPTAGAALKMLDVAGARELGEVIEPVCVCVCVCVFLICVCVYS